MGIISIYRWTSRAFVRCPRHERSGSRCKAHGGGVGDENAFSLLVEPHSRIGLNEVEVNLVPKELSNIADSVPTKLISIVH